MNNSYRDCIQYKLNRIYHFCIRNNPYSTPSSETHSQSHFFYPQWDTVPISSLNSLIFMILRNLTRTSGQAFLAVEAYAVMAAPTKLCVYMRQHIRSRVQCFIRAIQLRLRGSTTIVASTQQTKCGNLKAPTGQSALKIASNVCAFEYTYPRQMHQMHALYVLTCPT
jgi:hypothetical protein